MQAHIHQGLSACVDALAHIQRAMDAGELEWALALSDTTLLKLEQLRQEVTLPLAPVQRGLMSALWLRDPDPVKGRLLNMAIGAVMGYWVGLMQSQPTVADIERLIHTLRDTRDALATHIDIRDQQARHQASSPSHSPTPTTTPNETQGEADG